MELVILCLWWAIIRGVGTTARNVSDLLHGRPVQVHRSPAYANGGGAGPAVSPSYTGRAIGTVAALTKESLTSGVASGWEKGKTRHAARVERREVKRAAKAARKAGAGEMAPAPELDTRPAVDEQPTSPAGAAPGVGGEAPRWPGAQQDGQPVWDVPADGGADWKCRNCGSGRPEHCPACRVCLHKASRHLGDCPQVAARIKAAEEEEAYRQAIKEQDEQIERERQALLAAGRCPQLVGSDFCGHRVAPGLQVCEQHTPVAEPVADTAASETSNASETAEDGARLYVIRGDLADDQPTDGHDEQFEAVPDQQTVPGQPAQDETTPGPEAGWAMLKGAPSMTVTTTGETTNIGATRAYFSSLAEYTGTDILGQLELANATLQQAEMDPETLGHLAAAVEHYSAAKTALEQALATLNSKHALMEEAVKGTPDAAKRDYYRE